MENFHYRLGTSYAVVTAILVSFQEPFSALAARSVRSRDFMTFTQLALVFSIPLLILSADSRRDFAAIVFDLKNWPKLIPAFSALISWMLSRWIPGLQFAPRPMFFIAMGLVTIPLLLLSLISWQARPRRHAESDSRVHERDVEPGSIGSEVLHPIHQ
jgi:hypothetical protein